MATREPFPAMNLLRAMTTTTTTAQYPYAGSGNVQALMYVGLGLNGEAGEVAEQIKKVARDDGGLITDQRRLRLFHELGDVMWYWLRACDELGFDPNEVIAANQTKLKRRKEEGTIKGDGEDRPARVSPQAVETARMFHDQHHREAFGGGIIDEWPGVKS